MATGFLEIPRKHPSIMASCSDWNSHDPYGLLRRGLAVQTSGRVFSSLCGMYAAAVRWPVDMRWIYWRISDTASGVCD